METGEGKKRLEPPIILDGVMAAILSEAQFVGKKCVGYIGFRDGIVADADDLVRFEEPLCHELEAVGPELIPRKKNRVQRYVDVARSAVNKDKLSMFL